MARTDNSPRLNQIELFRFIEARVRAAGSAAAFAAELGISPGHLSDIRNSRIMPSVTILAKLGIHREVRYRVDIDAEAVLDMIALRSVS